MGGPPLLGELGLGERRRKIYTSWQSMLLAASGWVHGSSSYADQKLLRARARSFLVAQSTSVVVDV